MSARWTISAVLRPTVSISPGPWPITYYGLRRHRTGARQRGQPMSAASAGVAVGEAARQARGVELLRGLVAIPSLSGDERAAVEYLCAAMADLGFATEIDGAGSAVGTTGERPREIVLLVRRIDAGAGEIPVWMAEGALLGRGSVDAEGAVATFVCAVARAIQAGLQGVRLTVIGAVDEEGASAGAFHVVDRYRPEFAL